MIIDYTNEKLYFIKRKFVYRSGKIFLENKQICNIPDTLFNSETSDKIIKNLDNFCNQLFRHFVKQKIYNCEISEMELVDINQKVDNIVNDPGAKVTAKVNEIRKHIESSNSVYPLLIYGNSASGKTTTVAQVVNSIKCSYTWIDLNDVSVEIEHFAYSVLKNIQENKKHIIVIDNVQSYPSKIIWIRKAIDSIRKILPKTSFATINICWRSAKDIVEKMYTCPTKKFEFNGESIIIEFIRENALEKFEKDILRNSAGDVLVAKHIVEYICKHGVCPSIDLLSKKIYQKFTHNLNLSNDATEVLYTLASLGEFEIHVREEYLKKISPKGYEELKNNKLFRLYKTEDEDNYISIGHRSMANKIVIYLNTVTSFKKSPIKLAIDYLTLEGEKQILSTLERLDIELEIGDSIFANLWQAFVNMCDALKKQLDKDITWGNNMASMIFAVEALNNMQFMSELYKELPKIVEEIRKRWNPSQKCTDIEFVGKKSGIGITAETIDFEANIKHTMCVDEQSYEYPANMLSQNIDYMKFHNNWLLGLLLGFEGTYNNDISRINAYIECAKKMQEPNGAFYPSRVCWVTARVIMGLKKCGLSYSDNIVKRACNWMIEQLRPPEEMNWAVDKLNCFGWRSGTGTWNSNEQITLMCICALFDAEYPVRKNEKTYKIVTEFWKYRNDLEKIFRNNKSVLDIMWIIDVMLYDNRNPIDMKNEIKDLSVYLLKQWDNASLLSSQKETESSDVSFMAKELIYIVWELLNKNIEQLLKGLELNYSSVNSKKEIFISYRREEGGGSAFAQSLYSAIEKQYRNNVFLDVYDLHKECDEFDDVISEALKNSKVVIAIATDHSFDRACFVDYDNSNDLYFSELKSAIELDKHVITIYNSTSKRPECPDKLKVNPEFYDIAVRLSKKNAVFYDATIRDAMSNLVEDVIAKINHVK